MSLRGAEVVDVGGADGSFLTTRKTIVPADDTPRRPRPHPQIDHLRDVLGAGDDLPIDPDLEPAGGRSSTGRSRPHPLGPPPPRGHRTYGLVFGGGALGTLGRYAVEQHWPAASGQFPTTTFLINTSGAFLLGVVLTVLLERLPHRARTWRPFLCTGVIAGWTTYSTFVVEADALSKNAHLVLAAGYLAITLLCGVLATALGIGLGRTRAVSLVANPDEQVARSEELRR